ncbi:MAG: 3-phosphoserine/phosphohydroxythreonine transaminase [Gammaproteobacteria bacterium]|nr:3-phosphoserine/phosphohydroxythreonine transaminase [Gammaproteobacteria bacterium]MCP5138765.1 3-phosphoserine/phosphohydroxythreonine transaminase [Chromatiales bacterium]
MTRVINFSAGPAALPLEVLQQAQAEMTDWNGTGMSVMEVSHRSKEFIKVAEQAEADLRELMQIPADYSVLFLQGGATTHFALLPMNLSAPTQTVDYLVTGSWSKKASKEAAAVRKVNIVADGSGSNYMDIPARAGWKLDPDAAYVHYCANETISGLEMHEPPEVGSVPLIADMSSTILSRPVDVRKFGVIYGGAQKNIGPSGLVILIVRKDLLERAPSGLPAILKYSSHAAAGSMLNTPPTFGWYMAGLVFAWLKRQGGLQRMAEINRRKAELLYHAIDASSFYNNPVAKAHRSWMNVTFTLADAALDADFLSESKKAGLTNLKGHRDVGGMRASIYNATSEAGVAALVQFMADFEKRRG